jgi:hypothetical protein
MYKMRQKFDAQRTVLFPLRSSGGRETKTKALLKM